MRVLVVLMLCVAVATAKMTQGFRTSVMDRHNEYRKEQMARYMYKLRWDDELENNAESYVSDCSYSDMKGFSQGYNVAYYKDNDNDMDNMYTAMTDWYNQRDNYKYNSRSCGNSCSYTQMVWYNTQRMGCAYRKCENFYLNGESMRNYWFFACFYDPRGNVEGEYPYMRGNRCSDCEYCDDGLCGGGQNQCFDSFDNCESRSRGSCYQNPWMSKFCMKTCGFC